MLTTASVARRAFALCVTLTAFPAHATTVPASFSSYISGGFGGEPPEVVARATAPGTITEGGQLLNTIGSVATSGMNGGSIAISGNTGSLYTLFLSGSIDYSLTVVGPDALTGVPVYLRATTHGSVSETAGTVCARSSVTIAGGGSGHASTFCGGSFAITSFTNTRNLTALVNVPFDIILNAELNLGYTSSGTASVDPQFTIVNSLGGTLLLATPEGVMLAPVPEPAVLAIFGLGALGIALRRHHA